MGTFYVDCLVANHVHRNRKAEARLLVDTGSEGTWVNEDVLRRIGVVPEKKDVLFVMANGLTVSREVGFAVIHVQGHFTVDEVVFALEGDMQLIGARTLEGLNLAVHSRAKKLLAAGPHPAAVSAEREPVPGPS